MSEVISQWILHRLGIIIDTSPETFAARTSNGHLLAQILQSYEIITAEELSIIKASDQVQDSYDNFKHINLWLRHMDLTLGVDDLYEIVHGVGSTSLHLFFQVFLNLKDRTKLDFLSEKELDIQLGKRVHRFCVRSVQDAQDPNKFDLHKEEYCEPFLAGGDVYHWYKNRIENLQIKCKDVRDEYVHNVKNRCKSLTESGVQERDSAFVLARGLTTSPRRSNVSDYATIQSKDDIPSPNLINYDNLLEQQKNVLKYQVFNPDAAKANIILKKMRAKSKVRLENRILRNQLHQEIMNAFETKINDSKSQSADEVLKDVFMQQSLYEKDLVTKLGQIKTFKEYMLENTFQQTQQLNKKKDKAFMDQLVMKNKELNETELTFYFERERQLQLHKQIYKEKLRLRKKRNEEMCANILNGIIDMSLTISEYKKQYGTESFTRKTKDQKDMFRAAQSVFDISQRAMDILRDEDFDIPEDILTRETFKENALDDQEFDRYMKFEWPWELDNVHYGLDMFNHINWGLNVLGYIAHRALSVKYPIVPLWEKPEFPECSVRVCLNGLNDTSILPNISNLLSKKDIKVVQLSEAVDFCIQAYKNESRQKYEQDVSDLETKHNKEEGKTKKGAKSKGKNRKYRDSGSDSITNVDVRLESKFVQTPLKFPCEEIPYTRAASLGRTAQELLNEGEPLGNFLLIDMFVQYLKSISSLKGWVLVNYPANFQQAAILEEAFSGTKLLDPNMRLTTGRSLSDISEHAPSIDKDECSLYNDAKGISKVLPNPLPAEHVKNLYYDTVLTAFVNIKRLPLEDKSGDNALPPIKEDLDPQPDPLEEFYSNAGANYCLYYKEFDSATIKNLAKLIIGDYSLPLKSSLELFGDIGNLTQPSKRPGEAKMTKKGEKLKKPKQKRKLDSSTNVSNKTSLKAEKKGAKGKSKVPTVYENKEVQVPSEDEEEYIELDESATEVIEAGQEGWQYTKMDCPEELLIALATLWENVEEIYINDLKQVFFLKRINLGLLMPFVQHVKDIMGKIINRPDYRSLYLSKFQRAFNSFEMTYRIDDEFKTEMYCRIEDFKENLIEMSDIKMMESENLRCRIINANWTPSQLTELINIYVNMIQIELDRFIDSVRLILDYYLGLMAEMPTEEGIYEEVPISKYHEINSEAVNSMLRDMSSTVDLSQFNELLSNVEQKVHSCTKRLNAFVASIKEKMKATQTTKPKLKTKSGSPKSEASKKTPKLSELETKEKDNYISIVEELDSAVRGETLRVLLRVDLLKYDALKSIEEFVCCIQSCFHQVIQQINSKYTNDIANINVVCNVFRAAVEKEERVQTELLLDEKEFLINPEVTVTDQAPIIGPTILEVTEDEKFTVQQLCQIADIFLDLSPGGYLPKSTFTLILQDIIWASAVTAELRSPPQLWKKLTSQSLNQVIRELFDDLEYVYWRDFIIYNIPVAFPTEQEILSTRAALKECDPDGTELIQDYQFFAAKLWFEDFDQLKQLLFKLYYIKGYGVNYTALLLDFCKAPNSVEGFAKALALSLGKKVCWSSESGNKFKELLLEKIVDFDNSVKMREKELDEYFTAVHEELSKLLDQVVNMCEGVIIEELELPQTSTSPEESLKKSMEAYMKDTSQEEVDDNSAGIELEITKSLNPPNNVYSESNDFAEFLVFLPLDPILAVITAAIPWHSRVQNVGDLTFWEQAAHIFESAKNPDFQNCVFAHEFLNTNEFLRLLSRTKKFSVIDPVTVVKDALSKINNNSP